MPPQKDLFRSIFALFYGERAKKWDPYGSLYMTVLWGRRGGYQPPGGVSWIASWAMHPPFSFRSCRKENGPCTVQKKRTLLVATLHLWCKVAVRGSTYRCKRRFCLIFGHAILFCDSCNCRPVAEGAEGVGVQGRIW